MRKKFLILGAGLILIVTIYLAGLYPAMRVEGEWVSEGRVNRYAKIIKNITSSEEGQALDAESFSLEKIIRDSLVKNKLNEEFGKEILAQLVNEELKNVKSDEFASFNKLIGLSKNQSMEFWLMPSIRESILKSKLVLKGEDFNKWLEDAKKSAEVTLFSRKFLWDGTSVRRN